MRLRFTPATWHQWHALCAAADTEIGCYGISSPDDPLLVVELCVPEQECTSAAVDVEPTAIARHIGECMSRGIPPERSCRIWLHTHPGQSAQPSGTDEKYWAECEQAQQHGAVMAMLAKGGQTFARVRLVDAMLGPVDVTIPVECDLSEARAIVAAKVRKPAPVASGPVEWYNRSAAGQLVPLHETTGGAVKVKARGGRPQGMTKKQFQQLEAAREYAERKAARDRADSFDDYLRGEEYFQ